MSIRWHCNQQKGPRGSLILHSPVRVGHATTVTHSDDRKGDRDRKPCYYPHRHNQQKEVDGSTLLRLDADDFSPSTPRGWDTR